MNKNLVIVAGIVLGLLSVLVLNSNTNAAQLNSRQVEAIRSNCVSTVNTLNQLHASDALLRVNRGQLYESISTKLMSGFNSRVGNNGFNNVDFNSLKGDYDSALNQFRADYIKYETSLSVALSINCYDRPVEFYDSIAVARSLREVVHSDVLVLNGYIDKYNTVLNQFIKDYENALEDLKR